MSIIIKQCLYIFQKGVKSGEQCKRKVKNNDEVMCKLHKDCNQFSTQIQNLPELVHDIIIKKFIESSNDFKIIFKFLISLKQVSKYWNILLSDKYFELLYNKLKITNNMEISMNKYSLLLIQKLNLLLTTGCQRCKLEKIRKIHWPFPIRLCKDCIEEITISDFRLNRQYNIPNHIYNNLDYIIVPMWNRHAGSYTLRFYIKREIEERLRYKLM
jgi:hypothetical protein